MIDAGWLLLAMHVGLAIVLFFLVNWVGEHAVDFGYSSTTLFEEPNESVALNFFIRSLSPAVFIIIISSAFVASNHSELRIGILMVVPYYYVLRASVIVALNRQLLISWARFIAHASIGIGAAYLAYNRLILPKTSLLPDLATAGNELWLALFAFLYAVANKVPLSGGPGARRRNSFIKTHYEKAKRKFGHLIDGKMDDDLLRLLTYSVIIYEDYCRPPAVRALERFVWWKNDKSTGIMQVRSELVLDDAESVIKGTNKLLQSWSLHAPKDDYYRLWSSITDYNKDDDYAARVMEVMEILAKRTDLSFGPAYARAFGVEPTDYEVRDEGGAVG